MITIVLLINISFIPYIIQRYYLEWNKNNIACIIYTHLSQIVRTKLIEDPEVETIFDEQ